MSEVVTPPATWEAVWDELVTVGLLGTDRRDPPELPPGAVGDAVDDALAPTPAARLLTAVAAVTVARRAGITAGAPRPPLLGPDVDERPLLPIPAARRWHAIVANWPILEPEWLTAATASGWRPPPDVLVAMLRRTARTPARRAAVLAFGGSSAAWLVDHLPELGGNPATKSADAESSPERTIPAGLRTAWALPPEEFAAVVVAGLHEGVFRWAHRGVLLNTVAAVPSTHLPALLGALVAGRAEQERRTGRGESAPVPLGLWESLIELADVRRGMLDELSRPGGPR